MIIRNFQSWYALGTGQLSRLNTYQPGHSCIKEIKAPSHQKLCSCPTALKKSCLFLARSWPATLLEVSIIDVQTEKIDALGCSVQ